MHQPDLPPEVVDVTERVWVVVRIAFGIVAATLMGLLVAGWWAI